MSTASGYILVLHQQVALHSNSSLSESLYCFIAVFFSHDYHIIGQAGLTCSLIGLLFGPNSFTTVGLNALSHLFIYLHQIASLSFTLLFH